MTESFLAQLERLLFYAALERSCHCSEIHKLLANMYAQREPQGFTPQTLSLSVHGLSPALGIQPP